MRLIFDFEASSNADIKKCGADRYAEDPSTEILALSWQIGKSPIRSWAPFLGVERLADLYLLLEDGSVIIEAHNIRFERAIWREIMVKRYDAPPIAHLKMSDTMARCGYKSLPLKLEAAAAALNLENQKDMTGHKAMLALARGHEYKKPEMLFEREQQMFAYCEQDVRTEYELGHAIGELSLSEQKVFGLDLAINDRGVRVDLPFVELGMRLADEYVARQTEAFRALTGLNPSQRDKVLGWCNSHGANLTKLRQEELERGTFNLPELVLNALELRRSATRATVKKFHAMRRCVCNDGRIHGICQYHGATTGRWAGRLIQPQNFKRPGEGDIYLGDLVEVIKSGDLGYIEACYGDAIAALSDATRAAIIPAEGKLLTAGDLASIETHVLMWLAGETEACQFLGTGQKLYIPMAETIYRRPIDKKKDLREYTVGKIAILQLGYQAGWRGFQASVLAQGGVAMEDGECQMVVDVYRKQKYPRVPELWRGLEDAMFEAVARPGREQEYAGIVYHLPVGSRWLTCRLPSGRLLHYFNPEIVTREMPWTREEPDGDGGMIEVPVYKECVRYWAWKEGRMKPVYAYGGHNTENVVQAISRDLLVCGMFRAEKAGLPVIFTVHDEIVCEHNSNFQNADKVLEQCMTELPRWGYRDGLDCPMGASTWTNERYVK